MNLNSSYSHKYVPANIPLWLLVPAFFLALILNHYKIPFFAGSHLIFGNIIAIIVLFYYGLMPALFISLLAGTVTYFTWGNAINLIPNALEIIVLNLAIKRLFNPMVIGMIYWATLGWMLTALSLYLFTDFELMTKYAIIIKYFVNGILNLLVSLIIVRCIAYYFNLNIYGSMVKFSHKLTNHIFYIVSITLILSFLVGLKFVQQRELASFQQRLKVRSDNLVESIEGYTFSNLQGLELAAKIRPEIQNPQQLSTLLASIKSTYPSILTMLATDGEGKILASAPAHLLQTSRQQGTEFVSDRPYFYKVQKTGESFISEVFRGRGFGSDAILALSVPIVTASDNFIGIIEASLDLNMLGSLDIKPVDSSESIIILDRTMQVIYASPELNYYFLESVEGSSLAEHIKNPNSYFVVDDKQNSLITSNSSSDKLGWTVITSISRETYESIITTYVVIILTILGALIIGSIVMSRWLANEITSPLKNLSKNLEAASNPQSLYEVTSQSQNYGILEIIIVQETLRQFALRSKALVNELEQANYDKEKFNSKLTHLNQNLETLIHDKTQKLKRALVEAEAANDAKTLFLANVSHEIRTPINGVVGMLTALESSIHDKEQKELLNLAQYSANNLLVLINDILNYSKIEAGSLEFEEVSFDLYQLVEDIISTHRYAITDKTVVLNLDYSECKAAYRVGDPLRIGQIFNNLISNALKFTKKGHIDVVLKDIKVDNKLILCVAISDTGIGISEDAQSKLFDAFEQADASTTRNFGGTGLGLSISKKLCEQMHGSLSVISSPGQGSTFSFHITLEESKDELLSVIESDELDLSHLTQTLLLIEDNPINQKVVEKVLERKGVKLDIADNGEQGLATLKANPDKYFMVLMDCQMPVMDGFTATMKIRAGEIGEQLQNIPIVAITANAFDADINKCLSVGMNDYLSKPIDFIKLIKTIHKFSA